MWGSLFLLIDIGVDHARPELVALLRVVFGAATAGRPGWPPRASVTVYFLPPVAIALGALLRDEPIAAVSIVGTRSSQRGLIW